jgi:hypothetical protein
LAKAALAPMPLRARASARAALAAMVRFLMMAP